MKTITIITPSNTEVEYRLAGVGSRMAAFLIDFTLQILLIMAVSLTVLLGVDRGIFGNTGAPSGEALGFVMIFSFIVQFGYFIICELTMNGQSFGKRIFGLRVIRESGLPLGFSQSLVRGLLRTTLDMMYVGIFIILFSKKHKRLGDMAAGTIVISENYAGAADTALVSTEPDWPNYLPDRFLLTPDERLLAEEWLACRENMQDGGEEFGDRLVSYFQSRYTEREDIT